MNWDKKVAPVPGPGLALASEENARPATGAFARPTPAEEDLKDLARYLSPEEFSELLGAIRDSIALLGSYREVIAATSDGKIPDVWDFLGESKSAQLRDALGRIAAALDIAGARIQRT